MLRRNAAPKGSDAIRSQNDAIPRIIRQTIPLMSISDIPLHKDNNARCQAFVSVSVSFLFSLQCSTFIFSFWSLCCCYNCNYVIVIMMCKSIDGCMSYPPDKTTSPLWTPSLLAQTSHIKVVGLIQMAATCRESLLFANS